MLGNSGFVHDVAKPIVLSLSKEIIPATIKESLNDLMTLQKTSGNDNVFSSASGLLKDSVSDDFAKSIPLDVCDFKKKSKLESKQKKKKSQQQKTQSENCPEKIIYTEFLSITIIGNMTHNN